MKRGAVTLTRNVQTVRLMFKSRAAVICTVFDGGKTEEGCQQSEAWVSEEAEDGTGSLFVSCCNWLAVKRMRSLNLRPMK